MIGIIIIFFIWFTVVALFISFFCLVKKNEMETYRKALLREINNSPEKILKRRVTFSEISCSLEEIKQNPHLLDYLDWDSIEILDLNKLFQPREKSPDRIFLRKIHNLPEEALQRKVSLHKAKYSLKMIKKEWQTLFKMFNSKDWLPIWNDPRLVQIRTNPR